MRTLLPLALTVFVAVVLSIAARSMGIPLLPTGPALQNARATRALVELGTLEAPEFRAIHNTLIEKSARTGKSYWQDVYTLGWDGTLYPKHSLLTVLLSSPLYACAGDFGFWVVNTVSAVLLVWSMMSICTFLSSGPVTFPVLLVCLLLTQTPHQLSGYSYDFIAGALLMTGVALSRSFPLLGGLGISLPVLIRPSHVLLVPLLIFVWRRESSYEVLRTILGCSIPAILFLALNWKFFGDPFSTAYHHLPLYRAGDVIVEPHAVGFSLSVLSADWGSKLFSLTKGLLVYNPGLFVAPFIFCLSASATERRFLTLSAAAGLLYFCYVFSYEGWHYTLYGNRFAFPAIYLLSISSIIVLIRLSNRKPLRTGKEA